MNRSRSKTILPLAITLLAVQLNASTLVVDGILKRSLCNPNTGKPHSENQWESVFRAELTDLAWRISVTNSVLPAQWEIRGFDGTNSYVIAPSGSGYLTTAANPPNPSIADSAVVPSPFPVTLNADPLGVSLVQIALTWNTEPGFREAVEMGAPPPWNTVRECKENFGYRWHLEADGESSLYSRVLSIRDHKKDKPIDTELQSLHSDYPDTTTDFNARLRRSLERQSIADEWIRSIYVVEEWKQYSGRRLPKTAQLETFLPPPNGTNHHGLFRMEITSVTESAGYLQGSIPKIGMEANVLDYRFKTNNGSRIYPFASYSLPPNATLRALNDAELIKSQQDWLRKGRKISQFIDTQRRWITWLFLGVLLVPLAYASTRRLKQQNKN